MKKSSFLFIVFFTVILSVHGQTQNMGWFFLSHTQKVSEKFDIRADVQTRSANKFDYFGTLLLRGALSYNINKAHSVALGYAYKGDWLHEDDGRKTYSPENRIYQQYLYDFKAGKTELNLRGRLEQRFVKEDGEVNFSQRARVFISAQIPLISNADFSKGFYTGVQNEIFFNVQNKANVNNSMFDQNRTFGSLGYRWSKKVDTEFGYMYWYQKEMDQNTKTNVWQLMLTTSF